jgi:hypothetical protein
MSSSLRLAVSLWASFVLGVVTLVLAIATNVTSSRAMLICTGLSFFFAILCGIVAKIEGRRSGGPLAAWQTVPTGIIVAAFGLLPVFVGAAEAIRWAAVKLNAMNGLVYIGRAFQAYEKEHGRLPPAAVRDAAGRPLLSWRVLLLPYLEAGELYREFHLDEPWDSPHNRPLLDRMPGVYRPTPGNPVPEPFMTYFQVFVGKGSPFGGEELTLEKIKAADGGANTILVVEGGASVAWSKPVDLSYAADQPLPPLGNLYLNECYVSPRGSFLTLFADGSIRCFFHDAPESLLRPLITWNGGEPLDWSALEPWHKGRRREASLGQPWP